MSDTTDGAEVAPAVETAVAPLPAARRRRGPLAVEALFQRPLVSGFLATIGVLGAILLGSAFMSIGTILLYIVLAMFLALGLDPIVRLLERKRVKRPLAILIVFGCFAVLFVLFLVFVLPPLLAQIGEFIKAIPEALEEVDQTPWFAALPPDMQAAIAGVVQGLADWIASPSTHAAIGVGIVAAGVGFVAAISASFVVVALTLYFLASLDATKQAFYLLAPAHSRPKLQELTERITASVGSALLGSVTLSALNAGTVFVLHLLIGLPFAALMAVIAFVITLIPLFGSVIFLVIGTAVALFSSPMQALIFLICYLVYIQVESYVLSPRIMNRAISIPAALVLIAAMVGGALGGVIGVLVALPVTASILLIIREIVVPRQDLKITPEG
ncbi:AI-2E family transporter [Microbacterium sp. NEAU-LLC]|uniref:AI-2E family transporter n=1 Tax=Microbacterium helvum TaxID=2773713 RepID=A0ABR8NQR8_9MICO|nr:AI-2E family transporter [Microbacterium helvum]MBD3942987.1 AI-2E family transporter [Microbacterium helvum]